MRFLPDRRFVALLVAAVLLGGCGPDTDAPPADPGAAATPSTTAAPEGVGEPGAPEGWAPRTITDAADRSWRLEDPPRRILSLVPSATLLLLELGQEARLVGRTDYDDDPRVSALPSVGGGLGPSLEVMLSLRPDLVLRFEGPTDPETPRRLDEAGIPHLALRPDHLDDVYRITALLGEVTGQEEAAQALVARLRGELAAVARAVEGADRPRVGILLGGDPPWVAGGETFIHDVVTVAGGENVFADDGPLYAPISVEEVLHRRPDVLLMTEGARVPEGLRRIPVLRAPSSLQSPGPDIVDAAWAVARLLHPDRVP
jgi:iron complex transport system substrate-binding protein